MMALDEAWKRGFKAGEVFSKHCPYSDESPEARSWFLGWNEGSSKSLGFPYKTFTQWSRPPVMPGPLPRPLPLGAAAVLEPGLPPLPRRVRRAAVKPRAQGGAAAQTPSA